MNKFRTSPFGTWETPITSSVVSSSGVQIKEISVDDGHVYWLEGRPDEGGRNVLVTRACNGALADVTPKGFNVRNSVHEYGGGSYVIHRGVVYFCNWDDQRIYRQCMGEAPVPITPAPQIPFEDRYADLGVTPNGLFLTCVRERHVEGSETVNEVVSVSTNGLSDVKVVATGYDFYSSPRVSLDGRKIAWLSWNHPNMPWDGTELWLAELDETGVPYNSRCIAGGLEESIFQPQWLSTGDLCYVSDSTGWWNLYRYDLSRVVSVAPMKAEFGSPQWVFGQSTYALATKDILVFTCARSGIWRLGTVDLQNGLVDWIDTPYTEISQLRAANSKIVFRGASPVEPSSIVMLDVETKDSCVLRRAFDVESTMGRYFFPGSSH